MVERRKLDSDRKMTPEEQQQVNAGFAALEQMVANMGREVANRAMVAESLAMQLKAAKDELAELKKPKDNVVPIEGSKA